MKIPYKLLENIIYIEICLVFLIVIVTYVLKIKYYLQAKKSKIISQQIEFYLLKCILSDLKFSTRQFPKSWRRLDLIFPIIHKFNQSYNEAVWGPVKKNIAEYILLPIARKKCKSSNWVNRLLSAKCFELAIEKQDAKALRSLLRDKVPLVHMHAVIATVKFNSATLVNMVIDFIAEKRRLAQTIYFKIFESATPHTKKVVRERLLIETDPFIKATCYKILTNLPHVEDDLTTEFVKADINSQNIEVKLSAIRYLAYARQTNSIPTLLELLFDKRWEVRSTIVRLLGNFRYRTLIPQFEKCLTDSVFIVRLNAANALKNVGEDGVSALYAQDPDNDLYAYETAMHVLNQQAAT